MISRAAIHPNALKVVSGLREAGYVAYLVGGCVRDLMLGHEPKDFDVVTDARPEEIKRLFRNARLIGRRFRLAHVHFGREIVEVATFRGNPPEGDELAGENVYGSQEEDAFRRDFTVNALYYDPDSDTVTDYVGGVEDLKQGILRTMGDPELRYREDPVRMLRAVRFAAKLGFKVAPDGAEVLPRLAPLLRKVSPARMFEEVLKLFHGGNALDTYELLRHYNLFAQLFPATETSLSQEQEHFPLTLLPRALENTDVRVRADKSVNPAFLFAAILWEPVRLEMQARVARGAREQDALQGAADTILREQLQTVSIPKRFGFPAREIWEMQSRFKRRTGKQPIRLLGHKRFRAAYDFLLLRAEVGEESRELADWWTAFQQEDAEQRIALLREIPKPEGTAVPTKRRRRRRRRTTREREPQHAG